MRKISLSSTVVQATGHKIKHIDSKTATTSANGNIEYWYCETCKMFFSDANGKAEIAYSSTVIPATGAGTTNQQSSGNSDISAGSVKPQPVPQTPQPQQQSSAASFTDVNSGDYYAAPVAWAVEKGITNGVDATHFAPSSPVSRAQAVTFLWRAQGKPSAAAGDTYADVEAGSYYEQAVQWAAAKNVTQGHGQRFRAVHHGQPRHVRDVPLPYLRWCVIVSKTQPLLPHSCHRRMKDAKRDCSNNR